MHTEVVIHSMIAYVWCWSKIYGSLDEIPSVTIRSCKSKIKKKKSGSNTRLALLEEKRKSGKGGKRGKGSKEMDIQSALEG